MKWQDGIDNAAAWAHEKDDVVAAVLLTEEETAAVWPALFPDGVEEQPARLGVMVSQIDKGMAFIAGFGPDGCLVGSGSLLLGQVIDVLVQADVKSEFFIVEPRAKGTGA